MRIVCTPTYSFIHEPEPVVDEVLFRKLVYRPNSYRYSTLYQMGKWSGYYHFYNVKLKSFPTGLLPIVCRLLEKEVEGLDYEVEYYDVPPLSNPDLDEVAREIKARDYQAEALELVSSGKHHRGIIDMPTGSGKTRVLVGLVKIVGTPAIVVTHRHRIMVQQLRELRGFGVNAEIIKGEPLHEWPCDVVITSYDSLYKYLRPISSQAKLLVSDEAHRVGAKTYYKAMMSCKAPYRFGLTATPEGRSDRADLKVKAAIGMVVYSVKPKDLLGEWLAYATVVMISNSISVRGFDWHAIYDKGIVRNPVRNRIIAEIASQESGREGKKTMIICNRLEHMDILKAMMEYDGLNVYVINGRMHPLKRTQVLDEFIRSDSKGKVLLASPVGEEGIDIPDLECLIMAGGGKAPIQIIQRIGRGLRRGPGKEPKHVIIYDFYDKQAKSTSVLSKHSKKRYNIYVKTFGQDRVKVVEI